MNEFTHDGDDNFFGFFAVLLETFGKFFEKRVVNFCRHSREVEGAAQRGGTNFDDGGSGST